MAQARTDKTMQPEPIDSFMVGFYATSSDANEGRSDFRTPPYVTHPPVSYAVGDVFPIPTGDTCARAGYYFKVEQF